MESDHFLTREVASRSSSVKNSAASKRDIPILVVVPQSSWTEAILYFVQKLTASAGLETNSSNDPRKLKRPPTCSHTAAASRAVIGDWFDCLAESPALSLASSFWRSTRSFGSSLSCRSGKVLLP